MAIANQNAALAPREGDGDSVNGERGGRLVNGERAGRSMASTPTRPLRAASIRILALVCALAASACQLVSGLSSLETNADAGRNTPGVSREDASTPEDAARPEDASPSASDAGSDAGGDSGVDAGGAPDDDAGSDAGPPTCAAPSGSECDPVAQCGCEQGQHCQVRAENATAACFRAGSLGQDRQCSDHEQCGSGTGCDQGVCRRYCAKDEQCEAGSSCLALSDNPDDARSEIGVCYPRCNRGNGMNCASGLTCQTLRRADTTRSFCIAPLNPCPTREDGICDEAEGTGSCATGSDAKDCECAPRLSGALCDQVEQCGCPSGRLCQVNGTNLQSTLCVAPGPKANGEICGSDADCKSGSCLGGVCKAYCNEEADCDNGVCLDVYTSAGVPARDVKACLTKCDFATGSPCLTGTVCAKFAEPDLSGDFCIRQDPTCSLGQNDGVCDETTHVCPPGTDAADCVCAAPVTGGQCDPVKQCGCNGNLACHATLFGNRPSTACTPAGAITRGHVCSVYTDCERGYGCFGGLCKEYCMTNNDCSSGVCMLGISLDGIEFPTLGTCFPLCDFASGTPCETGSVCANVGGTNTCIVPIMCPADLRNNGQCDEPEGTRICIDGSDTPDCP